MYPILFFLVVSLFPFTGFSEFDAHQIVSRADKIINKPGGYEYLIEMEVIKKERAEAAYTMKSFFVEGKNRMLLLFVNPPRMRDQAILRNQEDQWIYFPALKRTMKISSRQQLVGSDFSYGDILNLNLVDDYDARIVSENAEEQGYPCYQIELTAKKPTALYDKVNYLIRKSDDAPMKREFYTKSGKELKELTFLDHDTEGMPRHWKMSSLLMPGNETLMVIKKMNKRPDLSDSFFTLEALHRK